MIKYSIRANYKDSFTSDIHKASVYAKLLEESTSTESSSIEYNKLSITEQSIQDLRINAGDYSW